MEIFDKHIRSKPSLDDLGGLGAALPGDSAVLWALHGLCVREAQRAMKAGHHTEGRRFGNLARQLQKLSDKPSRR
jgi:hypothetical protein